MALTYGIAFLAGVLSFFTPCVFALVPAFLAYLAGINLNELRSKNGFNRVIFLNTLCYVLGFTLVFTIVGLLLNSAIGIVGIQARHWFTRIGGIIIILFGVYMLGLLPIPWLERERKLSVNRKASYFTSFLFGMTFALGWTPCVGAVLGGIFTLAVSQPGSALPLLLVYSLGLSLPFLLVGTFYSTAARFIKLSARYTRIVSIILGVLLIIVGLLLFFNRLTVFGVVPFFTNWL
jgi:cytochrome c-type biogenesis protein